MAARFNVNEVVAAKRRVHVFLYDATTGNPLAWATDLTGCFYVDQSTGNYVVGAGTITKVTRSLSFADQTMGAVASNNVTVTAHPFLNGDGPVRLTTTGTLPTGLATATDYWIIYVDANTIAFATSRANAAAGTKITLTGSGTGTNKVTATGTTPLRPLDGAWMYEATQAETNFTGDELMLRVEKTGVLTPLEYSITMQDAGGFDNIMEGSTTYGDGMRLAISLLFGKSSGYTTGSYAFQSIDGSKTRASFTADATGRLTATIGDLTP